MRKISLMVGVAGLSFAAVAEAQLTRVGSGPVADAVEAKGVVDTLYISGITPQPLNPDRPSVRGDTRTQTLSILSQLGDILKAQGYGFGDVTMLQVYLVADPAKGGKLFL